MPPGVEAWSSAPREVRDDGRAFAVQITDVTVSGANLRRITNVAQITDVSPVTDVSRMWHSSQSFSDHVRVTDVRLITDVTQITDVSLIKICFVSPFLAKLDLRGCQVPPQSLRNGIRSRLTVPSHCFAFSSRYIRLTTLGLSRSGRGSSPAVTACPVPSSRLVAPWFW